MGFWFKKKLYGKGWGFGFNINKSISDRERVRFSVCGINYLI